MSETTLLQVRFKDNSAIPYCIGYALVIAAIGGILFIGGLFGNWLGVILAFVAIPALDAIVGLDVSNPTKQEARELDKQVLKEKASHYKLTFRLVTWIWVPFQILVIIWGGYVIAHSDLSFWEHIGFVFSIGICTGGLGINIAHELIHKSNLFEQTMGKILLVSVFYGHFYVEHIFGHHKRVSTDEDPASSRLGESFYSFWGRSIRGGFVSSWDLEVKRLQRNGKGLLQNQVLWLVISSLLFAAGMGQAFGWKGLLFFFEQSFFAISLLEAVNYIEHYGLRREEVAPGSFERVTPMHSWNAGFQISNYFLFKLQRHSDHHANAGRRYQILRSFPNSPQMPQGYPAMVLMALVPPLWFRVMNPLVREYQEKVEEARKLGVDLFPEPNLADAKSSD